jgi:membrane-associated phospholipid phosphatase
MDASVAARGPTNRGYQHVGPSSAADLNNNDQNIPSSSSYELSSEDGRVAIFSHTDHTLQKYFASPEGTELAVCAVVAASIFSFTFGIGSQFVQPHQRPIPYQYLENSGDYVLNLLNNEENGSSTVPAWQLWFICVICCPIIQSLVSNRWGFTGDLHKTLCVYLLALPCNDLVTWSIKVYVGYLRPIFYSQCKPNDGYEYCTNDDDWNARMSFPSGHASWSFCGLTLIYLFLERSFGLSSIQKAVLTVPGTTNSNNGNGSRVVFRYTKPPFLYRMYSILCLAPVGLAIFIASSRVVDNKHFPADVIAGSLIGASIATFINRLW